ncbi:glycosyltransferase family 2 protein [Bacillus sp. JJ1521]|uniref:glycosyltransferase family 2 protein n=1 Tax=Bacillus sp. JJ1521 TaxID=3122957 RepID=UPI002FFEDACA
MCNEIPMISVILCTYNRKCFLSRSIESILAQTYTNFELILVNNGSTDGSDEVCEEYAKKDSRIRLIHISENQGASNGRNVGLDNASCEYVTIVDDDDYCEPQLLAFLWDLISENGADISICGSWNDFDGNLEPYFIFDEYKVYNKLQGIDELLKREKYNTAPPTKLFRKTLFNNIRFPDNVLVDDIHVVYRVFANANKIVVRGKPLYRFTKHASNMTRFIQTEQLSPQLLSEYLYAFQTRTEYLSKKVPEIRDHARYSEWSYMVSMCEKIKKNQLTNCYSIYNFMIKELQNNISDLLNSQYLTYREINIIKNTLKICE